MNIVPIVIMTVMSFPWGDVTVAPQNVIDAHCIERDSEGRIVQKSDAGELFTERDHVCGCAQRRVREGYVMAGESVHFCDMWISADFPDCWPHEEAHCFGESSPDDMGYEWPQRRPL